MAVLQDLPTEILAEIFSYLPAADLAHTSHLSRCFYAISAPLLYAAPNLTTSHDDDHIYHPRHIHIPSSLEIFLRTLLTPRGHSLASLVHSLTLRWVHTLRDNAGPRAGPLLVPLSPLAIKAQFPNTQIMLLLLHLPRLLALDICATFASASTFDDFMKGFFGNQETQPFPPALQTLKEFRLSSPDLQGSVNGQTLLTIMTLPNITSVDVVLSIIEDFFPEFTPASTSNITKLELIDAFVSPDELLHILMIPRALTHFTLSPAYQYNLINVIEPLRASLQYLAVDVQNLDEQGSDDEDDNPLVPTIGSLKGWLQLHTLRCPLVPLLGENRQQHLVDVLPVGIRELEILHDQYYSVAKVVREVVQVLRRKQELVPRLHMVTVAMAAGKQRRILRAACDAAKVGLVELPEN